MITFRTAMCPVALTLAAACLAMPASAHATECKAIHAQIVAEPILGCATSAIGLCTSGTITGNHGLKGTTFFTGESAAAGPATAPNPAWTISYNGSLSISTRHGTLELRDTGIFDQLTGVFSSFSVVAHSGSSGRFAGAAGTLFIGGETVDGRFVTTVISGKLCLE